MGFGSSNGLTLIAVYRSCVLDPGFEPESSDRKSDVVTATLIEHLR
jgi:hypothetical protein